MSKSKGSSAQTLNRSSSLWKAPISLFLDLFYGSLPTPTFQLPDGRLQPDFLMDTFPDWLFFLLTFSIFGGVCYLVKDEPRILVAAIIPVAVHWILFFGHGLPHRSEKYFDLAGQIGYSSMLFISIMTGEQTGRSIMVALLSFIWSFRLGYFLFTRFLERGEDWRFVRARLHPGFHFFTWTSQGLWCFFQGQAILALNHSSTLINPPLLGTPFDYLGLLVWAFGLLIETTADNQKLDFVRRFPNRKTRKWIDEGLWAYSRHPNFFGESLQWVGISLFCYSGLGNSQIELFRMVFAPIFSAGFLMQTTVPWLDILADEKYRNVEGFEEYKRSVSKYLLLPRRPAWI